jgi:DNA-binding CsgD family transcriptional regulator
MEILRAENAFFFILDSKSGMVDLDYIFSIHGDTSYHRRYFEYYKQFDPLYPSQFGTRPQGLIFKTDDVIPYNKLTRLQYYNDFLVPQNVHSELCIRICSGERSIGIMDFVRSQKQIPFSYSDVTKAKLVADILSCFFQDTDSLVLAREELKLIEYWADSQKIGTILIDNRFNPVYCNHPAEELCKRFWGNEAYYNYRYGCSNTELKIPAHIVQGCKNLQDTAKIDENTISSQHQIISNDANLKILAEYSLIRPPRDTLNPMFIVSLEDLADRRSSESTSLIDYVPSKREQEIILSIADGLSNHEIAKRLFISKSTVDTHIRNILEKTGLKNRVQIINLLK